MQFFAITALINSLTASLFGYVVFRRNPKRLVNKTFGLINVGIAIWSLSYFFWQIQSDADLALLWVRLLSIGSTLIPIFYLNWILALIEQTKKYKPLLIIGYFLTVIFLLFSFSSFFVSDVEKKLFFDFWPNAGPLYSVYLLLSYMGFMGFGVFKLIQSFSVVTGQKKQQFKYVLFASLIAFGGGATNFFLWYDLPIPPYGNILVSLYPVIFTYTMVQHRLMDIRLVLRKSFIYIGLAIFVFFAYYATLWLDNTFFDGSYSVGGYLSAIVIAPLFLLGFSYISKLLKRTANKYFFTGLYDYQEVLETFARKISQTIKLDEVINVAINAVEQAMRVDNIALALSSSSKKGKSFLFHKVIGFNKKELENVYDNKAFCAYLQVNKHPIVIDELLSDHEKDKNEYLLQDAKTLKALGVSLVLPFVAKDEINSVCIVGRKITKDAYTKEDIDLLTTLSNQASIAIENARLYDEVQKFNLTLQGKVNEQTREIRQKNVHLEKLLKTQSEFLDIASHQLRTPVSVIRGIISMIQDGDMIKLPKEKQAEFIESASQKGAKLDQIINDILAASELDSRKFAVDAKTPKIQLEQVVDKAVSGFKLEAEQRGIDLKWSFSSKPLPQVIGNASMLEQAISNLISNALKYTPSTLMVKEARASRKTKGKVNVAISKIKSDIIVSVSDNGIGIPNDEVKKLFQKFIRASNATAMYTDGSGLGLFIVREVIEGHRGKVWLESAEGKGSTFYLSLPIAK